MSNFVHHEPCPKCLSKDNLGVWDDGHKWCFGCGYFVPAIRTIHNSRTREQQEYADPFDLSHCTDVIPEKPLKWLKQYGITDHEISSYGMCYERERSTLILAKDRGFYVGRNFGDPRGSKYIVVGKKPQLLLFNRGQGVTVVFTEDVISAIKVGRSYSACPILGSYISMETLLEASRSFKEIGIWLDSNMVRRVARTAQKARLLTGVPIFRVYSPLDPKCYSTEEIRSYIERARKE